MMRSIILQAGPMRSMLARTVLTSTLALASGCVYRMNIQQGNFLEEKTITQLRTGMTRSQVRYLLGTPMVPDTFDNSRWDYLYYNKKGRLTAPEEHRIMVFFQEDKVARVEREGKAMTLEAEPAPSKDVPVAPAAESAKPVPVGSPTTQPGGAQPPVPKVDSKP